MSTDHILFQIPQFLKVSNYRTEDKRDKLAYVRLLHDYKRLKCMKLF